MLTQLLYVSEATTPPSAETLDDIIDVSIRRNAECAVTGLLVYHGGRFLQVLEGDEATVETLMERIARDPRHRALQMLLHTHVSAREFGRWHMGLARAMAGDLANQPGFVPVFEADFDPATIGAAGSAALELLRTLALDIPPQC